MFHMYDKKIYMLLTPLPSVTNHHTFSDLLPLERDVGLLYGWPLVSLIIVNRPRPTDYY